MPWFKWRRRCSSSRKLSTGVTTSPRKAGVRSGVLYPMLTRMLDEGWLTDGWENLDPRVDRRPPRRYYELTDKGKAQLGALLVAAQKDARFARMTFR